MSRFRLQSSRRQDSRRSLDPQMATNVQLLISVRSAREAQLALQAGVQWIDLKEPSAGSLGPASPHVAEEVGHILSQHPLRSAALGELTELQTQSVIQLAQLFPTLKVGLSRVGTNADWPSQLEVLAGELSAYQAQLVPVVYADWKSCDAPVPQQIVDWCLAHRPRFALIDTHDKRAGDLFRWMSVASIRSLVHDLNNAGCDVVLAGSLRLHHLDLILGMPIRAVGIRGAVCKRGRDQEICPRMLDEWVGCLQASQDLAEGRAT